MFTGIVETTGKITETRTVPGGRHLRVAVGPMACECVLGASICVSGVCLTVKATGADTAEFDVITETLDHSTLGEKGIGDLVNLERSLRVGDRLDGHFVQGHVDGKATVSRIQTSAREHVVWLQPESALLPFLIPKGSVAIDGVSLTIAAAEHGRFSVALIPTTLGRTTLTRLKVGDRCNIETDIVTRTIVHRLGSLTGAPLTMDTLREGGFV